MNKQKKLLSPSLTSHRRLPINCREQDAALFESHLTYEAPPVELKALSGVSIVPKGTLFHGISILPDSFTPLQRKRMRRNPFSLMRRHTKRWISRLQSSRTETIETPVYWITDAWSFNYFHWLCDAIPRLFAASLNDENIELLLPGFYRRVSFIAESLAPFGLKGVRYAADNGTTYCASLMLPTPASRTGDHNDAIVAGIGKIYREYYGSGSRPGQRRRVYISRALASRRKIANENELLPVLEKFGFETVHAEHLSFADQVRLFSQTELLVGPHGGGLTNMLFMTDGGAVLEIFNRRTQRNNALFSLANACKLDFAYLQCEQAAPRDAAINADVICLPDELARALKAVIERK